MDASVLVAMRARSRWITMFAVSAFAATALADTRPPSPPQDGAAPAALPFLAFVRPIDPATAKSMVDVSWHPGCPVPIEDLRAIDMTYWGFDAKPHWGRLVVHNDVSAAVVRIFRSMYIARFPIRRMDPVEKYGGSDDVSMAADNTSSFNCRVKTGGSTPSLHSFGRAIDINTVENPYVKGAQVLPTTGAPYVDRTNVRPGMIVEGDAVTRAFDAEGFVWGARWVTRQDYQHFETTPSPPAK